MLNYSTMYYRLFNAITDAVEILHKAQCETEKMYISSDPSDIIRPLKINPEDDDDDDD